jgi:hypothetical protein
MRWREIRNSLAEGDYAFDLPGYYLVQLTPVEGLLSSAITTVRAVASGKATDQRFLLASPAASQSAPMAGLALQFLNVQGIQTGRDQTDGKLCHCAGCERKTRAGHAANPHREIIIPQNRLRYWVLES